MTASPNFLSLLSATNRGNATTTQQRALGRLAGAESFQSILDMARAGQVSSGMSISMGKGVEVSLTPEQLERLAHAADIAEAHGASRAVFLIDGQAVMMDVGVRTVLGAVDATRTRVLSDVDAIVTVGSPDVAHVVSPLATLGATVENPSLLDALSRRR